MGAGHSRFRPSGDVRRLDQPYALPAARGRHLRRRVERTRHGAVGGALFRLQGQRFDGLPLAVHPDVAVALQHGAKQEGVKGVRIQEPECRAAGKVRTRQSHIGRTNSAPPAPDLILTPLTPEF